MSSGNWMNNDGLYLKFGTSKATASAAGEFMTPASGGTRVIDLKLDLTTLTSSAAVVEDNLFVPANMFIEKVEVIAETAATSGGSATLDIGVMATDRTTEIDFNGLVAALAKTAYDAAGETNSITAGGTGAGALIGVTIGASPGYLCANYNTAAYTAGVVRVRVYYRSIATISQ